MGETRTTQLHGVCGGRGGGGCAACVFPRRKQRERSFFLQVSRPANVTIYHAGAKLDGEGRLVTSGGRVLGITAMAPTLKEALADAYAAAETVNFDGKYMRHDIGRRALAAMEEQ